MYQSIVRLHDRHVWRDVRVPRHYLHRYLLRKGPYENHVWISPNRESPHLRRARGCANTGAFEIARSETTERHGFAIFEHSKMDEGCRGVSRTSQIARETISAHGPSTRQ
jgi:hypothetical protein